MQSDEPEGTLMIKVGTHGICVLAWDGVSASEIEDALEVIREFLASNRPNLFTMEGGRTGNRITVQTIRTKATLKRDEKKREEPRQTILRQN